MSAAVFRDGEIVWADATGLADVDALQEATPDTQYRCGSITKTFTAAAVMQLRDAGLLALDDPLSAHVPGVRDERATIGRILSHSAGLQREPPGEVWETLESPSGEELLARLDEAEQVLRPGLAWHYSNLGFALLGVAVERASGIPYTRYVDERLLRPLGLARTTWAPREPWARGYFVQPYSETVAPEPPVDMSGTAAAGQLWSTTGDLARWATFLADPDPDVLPPETVEEMHTVHAMMDAERWLVAWGLGLELYRRGDLVWAGHGGAMPGHLAAFCIQRKEKVGAAVFTNSGAAESPEALALELSEKTLELDPPPPRAWRPQGEPPPEVAGVLGRWWSEGYEFVFRWRDGRLQAEALAFPEHRRTSVFSEETPDVYRTVSGRERGEVLRIVRDENGDVVKLYWATYPFTREPEAFD